jgi:hypothetical protein
VRWFDSTRGRYRRVVRLVFAEHDDFAALCSWRRASCLALADRFLAPFAKLR